MNLKEHLKNLIDSLIADEDCTIDSLSVSTPVMDDPNASAQDDAVKSVPTGEMFISIRVTQKVNK